MQQKRAYVNVERAIVFYALDYLLYETEFVSRGTNSFIQLFGNLFCTSIFLTPTLTNLGCSTVELFSVQSDMEKNVQWVQYIEHR